LKFRKFTITLKHQR